MLNLLLRLRNIDIAAGKTFFVSFPDFNITERWLDISVPETWQKLDIIIRTKHNTFPPNVNVAETWSSMFPSHLRNAETWDFVLCSFLSSLTILEFLIYSIRLNWQNFTQPLTCVKWLLGNATEFSNSYAAWTLRFLITWSRKRSNSPNLGSTVIYVRVYAKFIIEAQQVWCSRW